MPIHSIWIINKSGGLSYHRTLDDSFHPRLSANDYLVLASTFQSIHAIAAKVSTISGCSGIRQLDLIDDGIGRKPFRLHCLQSPTGVKLMLTATSATSDGAKRTTGSADGPAACEALLRRLYQVYADYAVKNPFQPAEMPIKSEAFDRALLKAVLNPS